MNGKNLAVDAAALACFVVVMNPAVTGINLHEWLSLAALAVLFVHCAQHVEWVSETFAGLGRKSPPTRAGHLVLDVLMLIALMVATVSGLMVSGAVLPAFGLFAEGYYFWDPLHAISAKILLALLFVHVVAHSAWLLHFIRTGKRNDGVRARTEGKAL